MDFYKVEGNKLLFYAPLSQCSNCHKKMVKWYIDVPRKVLDTAKQKGIEKETYQEFGICQSCASKGGFLKQCDCCGEKREFPREFKYQLTHYAKYPESETEYKYICEDCISNKAQSIIEMLAAADEISEVEQ